MQPQPETPRSGRRSALFRVFGEVRASEVATVLLLTLNCSVALIAYYVLKVVREPLILNTGGAIAKSYAAAVQALVLIAIVPVYSRLLARSDRRRPVQIVVLFFIVCIELFHLGAVLRVPYLGFLFFVWVGIFSLAIIAQFWSLANDLYDVETGERLFPVIALGAPAGSIFGAFLARQLLSAGLGPGALLQLSAGLLLVHLILYRILFERPEAHARFSPRSRQPSDASAPRPARDRNGLVLVLRNPYLRRIALLLVLLNLVNTTGEFILSAGVTAEAQRALAAALGSSPALDERAFLDRYVGGFYAEMFAAVNVTTLVLQGLVASRLVARFGIAGVLFALPLVAVSAYGVVVLGAGLWLVRIVKIAENSTDYSLMNTARAMLWLPTRPVEKYAAKQAVDTFFVRAGDVLSAGVVFAGTTFFGLGAAAVGLPRGFAAVNLVVIALWIALAVDLARRYRRLAASRSGAPDEGS